jgi:hypothetical protein
VSYRSEDPGDSKKARHAQNDPPSDNVPDRSAWKFGLATVLLIVVLGVFLGLALVST